MAERAERLAAERGGQAFTSLTDALAAVDVDVVVVCTPTGAHGEVAIEALAAGKHVIIEKPAEVTLAKTDRIIEAQQRRRHAWWPSSPSTGSIRPPRPPWPRSSNGELGRITSGIASIDWWRGQSYYDSGDWRGTWELDGGGALMNQGVHTVDLLSPPWASRSRCSPTPAPWPTSGSRPRTSRSAVVKFASGALGVLHGTTAAYPGLSARLQVHGDRGSVVIENDELTFVHLTPAGTDRTEKLMGSSGKDLNEVERLPNGR